MIKKIIVTAFLLLLLLFFQSFMYCSIVLMVLAFIWKKEFKTVFPFKYGHTLLIGLLVLLLCSVLPQYKVDSDNNQQLIYQDEEGNPTPPPMSHYLANIIFPEEELINLGLWSLRFSTDHLGYLGIGTSLIEQLKNEIVEIDDFYRPIRNLNWRGQFMMSGITSQLFNMKGWGNKTKSVYLIKPENYMPDKKYPVVFFCHGFFGNWKYYQGILRGLEDCFVLSLATETWNGLFTNDDVKNIFDIQLPFLQKMGYQIDEENLHLIGFSNGGSAADIAYKNYSSKFRTIVYMSTDINQTNRISSRILLVSGGKDVEATTHPEAYRRIRTNGGEVALFRNENDTHYIFLKKSPEIMAFLNEEMILNISDK